MVANTWMWAHAALKHFLVLTLNGVVCIWCCGVVHGVCLFLLWGCYYGVLPGYCFCGFVQLSLRCMRGIISPVDVVIFVVFVIIVVVQHCGQWVLGHIMFHVVLP